MEGANEAHQSHYFIAIRQRKLPSESLTYVRLTGNMDVFGFNCTETELIRKPSGISERKKNHKNKQIERFKCT